MDWCCIAAVNDEAILSENLCTSPALRSDPERLTVLMDQKSATIAYNAGLERTTARYCVFAHQDVYLPDGWVERLAEEIASLDRMDSNWAVAGLFGVSIENGEHVGRVWSSGIGKELGNSFELPIAVQSIDELLIILDRSKGLCFDEKLPGFHLYGTDIIQEARAAGFGTYVIHAPVVHNSQRVKTLQGPFLHAHDYLSRKWRANLPIVTPVTKITYSGLKARWLALKLTIRRRREKVGQRPRYDPMVIAKKLGYE
ncbi:Glycosyltransferase like family protein [Roseovarius marisflavi]|uniref:Glycosyltransferase like family protein n=1 Tax=Roseovarius marisflavi TaxID=1054996 RepID=A0A1M7CF58_9RHOB|nr:glycosyltransferase [Roseovarius marisflavi]SHL65858.1 Glycosyltransferase like family protein [Roseovarius marisflavi]